MSAGGNNAQAQASIPTFYRERFRGQSYTFSYYESPFFLISFINRSDRFSDNLLHGPITSSGLYGSPVP